MMAVELRENFVQIHSATKMKILFLNLFAAAAQSNDLAVLSDRLDPKSSCFNNYLVGGICSGKV
jgi:hypothetical protein